MKFIDSVVGCQLTARREAMDKVTDCLESLPESHGPVLGNGGGLGKLVELLLPARPLLLRNVLAPIKPVPSASTLSATALQKASICKDGQGWAARLPKALTVHVNLNQRLVMRPVVNAVLLRHREGQCAFPLR